MECACVNLCAISSIMLKNWYPSPRFHILLTGKVNRLVVSGKAWNRAENITKEGEERKERISILYTKYPDVNKKILSGYLAGSHRRKAWKKRSVHCAAFFFVTQLYPLYQSFIFPTANSGIFTIKIEVGFVTNCWDCRFPIKGGGIPSVCIVFTWLLNVI